MSEPHRRMEVTSAGAVAALLDPSQRRLIEPFFRGALSVAQAARRTGLKTNAMHYRVRKFQALGLLEATGEAVLDGHRVTLYKTSADGFAFPFAATPEASLAELLLRLTEGEVFAREAARSLGELADAWGVVVGRGRDDEVTVAVVPRRGAGGAGGVRLAELLAPGAPAFWGSGDRLELDYATAKELQAELAEVVGRYRTRQARGAQAYLLSLGLAAVRS